MVGLGLHIDLLVHALQRSDQTPAGWGSPLIGVVLAAAALAAALLARIYRRPGTVFLFALAILGLFPNPLSWIPAAVLLMAAASLALLDQRTATPRPAASPELTPVVRMGPDDAPLHWSIAPRFGPTSRPTAEVISESASDAAYEATTDATPVPARREPWGRKAKSLVTATVVAAAAVVIPLSLWPEESAAATSDSIRQTAVVQVSQPEAAPTTDAAPADGAADSQSAASSSTSTSSTTSTTTLTRIGPEEPSDPQSSVWYSDIRFGLTMALPADWAELPASGLADYDPTAYHLAAFADGDGPTHKDAYLNGIDVRVLAGSQTEDPPQELPRDTLEQAIKDGPYVYDYFQVVRPIHEVQIGDTTGLAVTVRITWNKRVMVKSLQACIANHCLYLIVLQTDDADWEPYQPVFDQILGSFTFGPQSTDD